MNNLNCSYTTKAAKIVTPVGHDSIMWFQAVAIPMISLFGITGNIFSFVILKDGALKTVSHLYLVCLSVFDSMTILTFQYSFYSNIVLQPILVNLYNSVTFIEMYFTNYYTCILRMYTSFSMRFISTWIIVMFSLDRFMIVAFPIRSNGISTIRNSAIVIGLTVVVSCIINTPFIFAFEKFAVPCTNRVLCRGNKILTYMIFIEIIFLSIVPSIIICFCNISIVIILKKRQNHSTLHSKKSALRQERRITIRLLLVSTAFVLLTFPILIITIIKTIRKLKYNNDTITGLLANIFHISYFLYLVNLSINFILYCLTGTTFRKAAWSLLCCQLKRMRHYRKVILKSNTSETNVTSVMPRRKSSNSSDKYRITASFSRQLDVQSKFGEKNHPDVKRDSTENLILKPLSSG